MTATRTPRRAQPAPAPEPTESKPLMALGRDVNGRFQSGNPGGPGNPFARRVASLRKAMLEAVSEQDIQQVFEAIKQKACQGDVAAARLLLSYSVGRPAESKDPDRMDIEEWRWLQEMRVSTRQFQETVNSMPAGLSCFLAALNWACNTQSNAVTPLAAGLARMDERDAAANGDAQPDGGRAPGERPARAPANGRKKSNGRPKASEDAAPGQQAPPAAPSTNGDTEPIGRVEATEAAAPDAPPPAPAPSANGGTESSDRHEGPGGATPAERAPAAPSAHRSKEPGGRHRASGRPAPAGRPPAAAPSANGGNEPPEQAGPGLHPPTPPSANGDALAAAEGLLSRLFGLLGQPPQDDRGPPPT